PKLLEVDPKDLEAMLERSKTALLSDEDRALLRIVIESLAWLLSELEKASASLKRLRQAFSINTKKTEKTSDVLDAAASASGDTDETGGKKTSGGKKKKPKGHGRNGASAYKGAKIIPVGHESLRPGDPCPKCVSGKLYRRKPRQLVRLKGQAPISANLWELEKLRCNLCDEVYIAKAPAEVGKKKYDETSASMIALLKYGSGLPFNRLAGLERNLGIPLPASTQWDVMWRSVGGVVPAYEELIRTGAQGTLFHHDDTPMKILALLKENRQIEKTGSKERTGMFTTGVVALWQGHRIALFFTGRQHAGENLEDVLKKRAAELETPIQMCDGSSRNEPATLETLLANCLTHGRRKFVEVKDSFPGECRHVLEALGKVYKHDAVTREEEMSPEERLCYHQEHSAGVMAGLQRWMKEQIEQKKVEPNSSLGGAFSYMLKRWDKLTLFLRKVGAPLDNNICERALKKAILHRKNALFYKTENGARVGDIFMSLIYTAELVGANPFDYLTELQKHAKELRRDPRQWMPWNYRETLAALDEPEVADKRL
ncbi:MAG: IS66 family transposase, partial [Gammaproteobacteria bacterium]|nr:IS66 family transposase [Gammaproteobacteria bacterium]